MIYRGDRSAYLRHLGVRLGEQCIIHSYSFGSEPWLVELGDRVVLAEGATFITHDGTHRIFRDRVPGLSKFGNSYGTIKVYNNCFIGMNTIILPDVKIGPNSIVASGSTVNKDIPPNTVVGGSPAKVICSLDEYVEKYKEKMFHISAVNRKELRRELTQKLWGEIR